MKLLTKITATGVALAAAMIAAPTAQAATGWDRCQDGYFCVFEHANGQGKYAMFKKGTADLGDKKVFNGYLNDKISSIWNRDTGTTNGRLNFWCVYQNSNFRPTTWLVRSRGDAQSKINLASPTNDAISSLRPQLWIKPPRAHTGYWTC